MKKITPKIVAIIFISIFASSIFAQPYNKNEVNQLDRLFMNPYSKPLDKTADVLTVLTLAAPAVLVSTPSDQWLTEGIMYTEACLFSYGLKAIGKACVERVRPYMYFDGYPQDEVLDGDYLNSWPSAHTTMAFTSAAFTSYVFSKYYPDSPWRFAVIGGTYAAATAVGILRMASGNHFLTDVLTGAAIGTLSGFIIPYVHTLWAKKLPETDKVQLQASPFHLALSINL